MDIQLWIQLWIQADGTWSDPLPNCYAPCFAKGIPMGESLDVQLNTYSPHGTSMNISCNENYELGSSLPIECFNGSWTIEPKCVPARCKTLPSPPLNGMVVVSIFIFQWESENQEMNIDNTLYFTLLLYLFSNEFFLCAFYNYFCFLIHIQNTKVHKNRF